MTNQRIAQPNFNNRSTEIPLSQRVYAFEDLPPETQKNLLRLQNTDGDFLKISSGETGRRVGLLIILIFAFIGLAAIAADSSPDLKRIVVFSADALLLLLWFGRFVWQIFKTFSSPLKNLVYLTPTQVVETLDGFARYRELKDGRIVPQRRLRSSGLDYDLTVEFSDGDSYKFWFGNLKKNVLSGKDWEAKALSWQQEAVGAFQRGDKYYFESHDVFSKLSESNTPVLQRKPARQKENLLLIITILLYAINGAYLLYVG